MDADRSPPSPSSSSVHSSTGSKLRSDSVSAHPLLSGGLDAASAGVQSSFPVKYKPRQRTSEPQTTYSLAPPSSTSKEPEYVLQNAPTAKTGQGESLPSQATLKLQQQSLQAVVQSELGLSNDSAGWALLQRLVTPPLSRASDRLWADLVSALSSGRVLLLLPREPLSASETITAGFLADHCVLIDNTSRGNEANMVTLSGLRGSFTSARDYLVFSSLVPIPGESEQPTLFASEAIYRQLLGEPVRRPHIPVPVRATKYTTFAISARPVTLSIPQQANYAARQRPHQAPNTAGKLASLFGQKPSAPNSNDPSAPSDGSSTSVLGTMPLSVAAFAIDRCVKRPDVAKGISRAAEARLRHSFGERWPRATSGSRKVMWDEIVDRCVSVLNAFQPPKLSNWSSSDAKSKSSLYHAGPETVAAALQDLYEQVAATLARPAPRRRPSMPSLSDEKVDVDSVDAHEVMSDEDADRALEAVEDVVTTELYDRLFCPSASQDAVDDENLAARIAGLNLLEISLNHLGLALDNSTNEPDEEREEIRDGLTALVQACGQELRRLRDPLNTSPRQKLEVLVAAHKLIVDRIALLPPIPQKEEQAHTTSMPPESRDIELSDDTRHFSGRSEVTGMEVTNVELTPRAAHPIPLAEGTLPEIRLPDALANGNASIEERSKQRTPSSADVILPILIWCILQANPQRLVSDLLYIERFHAGGLLKGESGYCLVNFQAVLEFLLHVDLGALGLGAESQRLLTDTSNIAGNTSTEASALRAARERVSTEVAGFALAAGKGLIGLGGAVEDGYRMLGGLLARTTASLDAARKPEAVEGVRSVLDNISPSSSPTSPQKTELHRQSLLRRASTPLFGNSDGLMARTRSKSDLPQRELQEVSPAGSVDPPASPTLPPIDGETRSTRSFSSLLSSAEKPTLGDRLASLARFASPDKMGTPSKSSSRPPSILGSSPLGNSTARLEGVQNNSDGFEAPPNEHFLTCSEEELRLGEISMLLADYRRLAHALARRGLFAPSDLIA